MKGGCYTQSTWEDTATLAKATGGNEGRTVGEGGGEKHSVGKPTSNSKVPDKMQENVAIILFSVAMTSLAAFAIFVPLVIIPSIRGMAVTHDFDPTPVRCVTVDVVFQQDSEECEGWSLCKQGCENPPTICHQVLVNYRKPNSTYPISPIITEQEYQVSCSTTSSCYFWTPDSNP